MNPSNTVVVVVSGSLTSPVATQGNLTDVLIYPNPWRGDKNTGPIAFGGLPVGSAVKIFAISGRLVKSLAASSTKVDWDLTSTNGEKAASGLYMYLVEDGHGGRQRGKLAIIR